MSRIDTLTRGAKSTAPQRILSGLRSSENQQEHGSNRRGRPGSRPDLGTGFAWDRAPGVTHLNAASLAHWALLSATTTEPKRSLPPLMDTSSGGSGDDGRFRYLDKIPF
jgi:hypothetical protein